MAANAASFPRSSSDVVRDVASGQVLAGMSIDFYAYTQIAESGEDVVGFTIPKGGTAWTPDPVAAIRGTPRRDLAARFISFVLSGKGQGLWALPLGSPGGPKKRALHRPPILPSLYDPPGRLVVRSNPFRDPPGFEIDAGLFETRSKIVGPLVKVCCIQLDDALARAWKEVREHPADARLAALFDELPFAAGDAAAVAARLRDPVEAEKLEEEWYGFFKGNYEEILRIAEGGGDG
jgi:spermidine/putrescine-binding protein